VQLYLVEDDLDSLSTLSFKREPAEDVARIIVRITRRAEGAPTML
jgi:hypothetical protein